MHKLERNIKDTTESSTITTETPFTTTETTTETPFTTTETTTETPADTTETTTETPADTTETILKIRRKTMYPRRTSTDIAILVTVSANRYHYSA